MQDPTCASCGAPVQRRGKSGPLPRYCQTACKQAAQRKRERASSRYSADRAAKKLATALRNAGKTCAVCGSTFAAENARALYCSKRCRSTANRAQEATRGTCSASECDRPLRAKGLCSTHYNRARYPAEDRHPKVVVPCDWCERPCQKERGQAKRYGRMFCSYACRDARRSDDAGRRACLIPESHPAHQRWVGRLLPVPYVAAPRIRRPQPQGTGIRWVAGTCHGCGDHYVAEDYSGKARFCSLRCTRRMGKARRRARKVNAYVADVSRSKIFERDGWRCQLCRRKVDRTKAVPHPRAPVLDHVLPLACGGTHEPANVQCAHYICNSVKAAGVFGAGEQLALIG